MLRWFIILETLYGYLNQLTFMFLIPNLNWMIYWAVLVLDSEVRWPSIARKIHL